MTDPHTLDRAFQLIMRRFAETGHGPHYTELATAFGASVEEGRRLLHDVVKAFSPSWLHTETDYLVSFPPFHNLPTQYRVTVDGEQKWFAQCGFEATAMTWLFPGKTVRVDAPCLDCNEPLVFEMRDGQFLRVEPGTMVGHLNQPRIPGKDRLAFL
jgi:hypothetical protein